MDKNDMNIPYIAYESMLAKEERQQRRLIVVIITLIVLLVTSNVIWIIAWNQYDYVDEYTKIDAGDGNANYIGEDGNINNGTYNSPNEDTDA